jgi:hypothetical protein
MVAFASFLYFVGLPWLRRAHCRLSHFVLGFAAAAGRVSHAGRHHSALLQRFVPSVIVLPSRAV